MIKFDVQEARKNYQDECKWAYRWWNYESYKKRQGLLLKEEEKIFRRDGCLFWDFKEYYDFINYEHEIDRYKYYWYKEYIKDFIYRREEAIDEELHPLEEDDDR